MATVKVKDSHLVYNGVSYFRGGTGTKEIVLGCYGEKKTPLLGQNRLDVKGRIPADHIAKATSTSVTIDSSASSKSDFGADISAIINGATVNLKGAAAFERVQKNELKLVLLGVMNNQMKSAINKSPKALENLKNYGNDARVIHQIFVITDAKFADEVTKSGSVNLSAAKNGIDIKLNGSTNGTRNTTVTIQEGAAFAYLLGKIDWDMKFLKKEKVKDIDDDAWGAGG